MTESFNSFDSPPVSQPEKKERSIAKIAEALAKAQAEMVQPEKNKTVEVKNQAGTAVLYTFDYADYNAIVEAVRGPLSKNGIAFTHLIDLEDRELILLTRLIHSSGEVLESIYPLPSSRNPKDLGGAITYGKRYCLSAITGCVADDDLDSEPDKVTSFKQRQPAQQGNGAASKPPTAAQPNIQPNKPAEETPRHPSEAQLARLFAIASEAKWTNEQIKLYMGTHWKISTTKDLTMEQYTQLTETIQQVTYAQACARILTKGGRPNG